MMLIPFKKNSISFGCCIAACMLLASKITFASEEPIRGGKPPETPAVMKGLFDVYEQNRQLNIPNMITPDLLLVSYSLLRENINQQTEFLQIRPNFLSFINGLQQNINKLPAKEKKEPAAQKAALFVTLIKYLLVGQVPNVKDDALLQAEYQLIEQAAGITKSPLLGVSIDYSQLKPRGRYTQSADLQQYFKAFKYASSANFFVQSSPANNVSPEEVALQLAMVKLFSEQIAQDPVLKNHYQTLVNLLVWDYGKANDLLASDIWIIQQQNNFTWSDASKFIVNYAHQEQKLPSIIDVPIDSSKLDSTQTVASVALGWRLIPTSTANDLAAMQALLYPNTQEFTAPCGKIDCLNPWTRTIVNGQELKNYFRATELLAALDIGVAQTLIEYTGENAFEGYQQAQIKAKALLAQKNGVNSAQLVFMQQAAKEGVRLESLLGFWTWQRYINLVYNKQPMSFSNKGIDLDNERKGAILKGSAQFYQSLTQLAQAHQQQQAHPSWQSFIEVCQHLQAIATQQQTGQAISLEDEAFLNTLDKSLLNLVVKVDLPIVVDVHTNPIEQQVVQEAIGLPDIIQEQKARGAQLNHYEFKYPMSQRLTNEQWRTYLKAH